MSTTLERSPVERERTEAVLDLVDALLGFSRSLRARGSDWATVTEDLTRGEVATLGVIDAHGTLRPGHIAVKLCVDASVISRQLAGLHKLGLVERRPDPADRRAELVALTAEGHERLRVARDVMSDALADRLDHWGVQEVRGAAAVVHDLAERLQQPLLRHPGQPQTSHSHAPAEKDNA